MNERMKRSLQKNLRKGEEIRWESGTQPFRILDGREGRRILVRWIVSTLVLGGLLVGFAVGGSTKPGPYIGLAAILALLVLSPIVQHRSLPGQRYFITDQRAIVMRADGSVYDMALSSVGESRLYPLDFGGAAIALGSILLEEGDKQLRWRAVHPNESADASGATGVRGVVFYRVEKPEEAMHLLSAAAKK